MNLKDRAIYRLPNGRELIACTTCDNKTVLFALDPSESGIYELNSEGRLLFDDRLTAWQIDDLFETGRVAAREMSPIVANGSTGEPETTNEQSI